MPTSPSAATFIQRGGGGESSLTITGLTPGVRYKVAMRARYGGGVVGPWSRQSVSAVRAAPAEEQTTGSVEVPPAAKDRSDGGTTGGFVRQTSTVATLSALSVSPKDIVGFDSDQALYRVGVASTVTRATVTATATHSGASVGYSGTDADSVAAGHQVDLSAGVNRVTVTVTAQDTTTTKTYSVLVNRGVTAEYGWRASDDLNGLAAAGDIAPRGIWSDGTTIWVVRFAASSKIYAFKASDKTRDAAKDFDTLDAAGNDNPYGAWSDGTTVWVSDTQDDKLYAYDVATKAYDSSKDFALDADNDAARGVWSDGATMWVADAGDDKLYAYSMSTKARDSSEDFDTLDAASNNTPTGIWSDDTTMWVGDSSDSKLYAYDMATKARVGSRDFDTLFGVGSAFPPNEAPSGLWSDGTAMWVGDLSGAKVVISYNLPVYAVSAVVDGAALAVTFSQDMATTVPANSAFTVKKTASGTESTVALTGSPAVSGKTVTLTLSTALAATDTAVKVSYAKPDSGNKLANSGGNEVSAFTDLAVANNTGATVPGAPTGLSATARGPARIDLAWTAPASDGGASISGYKVEVSTNGGTSFADLAVITVGTTVSYSHTGLSANSTRHYRVSATNSVGTGAVSNTASDVTNVFVRNLAQGNHEDDDTVRGLSQRFTTGSNVGGYTLTAVEVVSGDADGDDFTAQIFAVDTASGHPTGSARATLVAPTSFAAGTLTFTAPADTRLAASTTYALVVEKIGSESVVFERTTSTAEDSGAAANWGIENTYEWKDSSDTWRDDTTARALRISIRGVARTVAAPGQPTGLTATANGSTRIDLSWTAPTSDGGESISGYKIEVSTNAGSTFSTLVNTQTPTTYSHTGLTADTTRHYRVFAINSVGTSTASNTASATTPTAATAPGAPTGLTATANGTTRIDLSWTAPTSNGGAAISGYKIEVSTNAGSTFSTLVNTQTPTTYSHTGLTANTTRHYRVFAINSVGTSTASNTASATTPTAATAPGAPTALTATANGSTRIDLAWTAPTSNGGSSITGYKIEVSTNAGSTFSTLVNTQTPTTYSHTGLTANTTRHYRVFAINSVGTSTASNTASATTAGTTSVSGLDTRCGTTQTQQHTRCSTTHVGIYYGYGRPGRTQLGWRHPRTRPGIPRPDSYTVSMRTRGNPSDDWSAWTDQPTVPSAPRNTGTSRHYADFTPPDCGDAELRVRPNYTNNGTTTSGMPATATYWGLQCTS